MKHHMNVSVNNKPVRMIPRALLLIFMLFLMKPELHAQVISKTGTTSGQFLHIPVGARATALGGAVTASSLDATGLIWNPAGIAAVNNRQIMIEHSEWFAGIQHNFIGGVLPLGDAGDAGTVGLYVVALTMEDMEETTFEEQEGTGRYFGAGNYAVGASYARYLMENFAIGGTVKYVYEKIWNTSAGGWAVDFGTHYVTPFDGMRFGVRIANFGQKLNMEGDDLITTVDIDPGSEGNNNRIDARLATDSFDLPLMLQVGLAYDLYETSFVRMTVLADAISPSDAQQSVNLGTELSFYEGLISVQAGLPELFLGDDRMFRFALGGGVRYQLNSGLDLDIGYAMNDHQYLGITNRFSLKIGF